MTNPQQTEIPTEEWQRMKKEAADFAVSTPHPNMFFEAEKAAYLGGLRSQYFLNQQQEHFPRWVKAVNYFPFEQIEYHVRWRATEEWVKLTAFYDNDAKDFYTIEPDGDMLYLLVSQQKSFEWLEESPSTPSIGDSSEKEGWGPNTRVHAPTEIEKFLSAELEAKQFECSDYRKSLTEVFDELSLEGKQLVAPILDKYSSQSINKEQDGSH